MTNLEKLKDAYKVAGAEVEAAHDSYVVARNAHNSTRNAHNAFNDAYDAYAVAYRTYIEAKEGCAND